MSLSLSLVVVQWRSGLVLLVHAWESGEMSTAVLNVVAMLVWIFLGLGKSTLRNLGPCCPVSA
jgi:hypothetical protein